MRPPRMQIVSAIGHCAARECKPGSYLGLPGRMSDEWHLCAVGCAKKWDEQTKCCQESEISTEFTTSNPVELRIS